MRKILIAILLVLLIVLAGFTIFQGISIGSFQILSAQKIISLDDSLTAEINQANTKIKNDLQNKKTELNTQVEQLLLNKEGYYEVANVSTESEINKASTQEVYDIAFLFLKIGRHGRAEGVNFRMDIISADAGDTSVKDIAFTVTGAYSATIEFIRSLEDDSELSFKIEDFHMIPAEGNNLETTFNVKGVRINPETLTENSTSTDTTSTGEASTDTTELDQTNTNTVQ